MRNYGDLGAVHDFDPTFRRISQRFSSGLSRSYILGGMEFQESLLVNYE